MSISPLFRWPNSVNHFISKIDKVKALKEMVAQEKADKVKSIEDHINRLSSEISSAMADAFASAKKKK